MLAIVAISTATFAEEELERYQMPPYRMDTEEFEHAFKENKHNIEVRCSTPEECERVMQEQFPEEYDRKEYIKSQYHDVLCNTPKECKKIMCEQFPEKCEMMQRKEEFYKYKPCNTPEECMKLCQEHPERCMIRENEMFSEGFTGPGNCRSPEECREYCTTHEEECRTFKKSFKQERRMYPKDIDPVERAMYEIFNRAQGMSPQEFKQYCPDATSMVDAAINKLQEQNIEMKANCHDLELSEEECNKITPEAIRERMIKHATLMCNMMRFEHEEGMGEIMMQMMEVRSEVPPEIQPAIDKEAEKMYRIHQEVVEEKEETFLSIIKRLFGIKERKEAERIRHSAQKLEESIQNLQNLHDQINDLTTKEAIAEQLTKLEAEKQKLLQLAQEKEEGISPISGAFTGLFAKNRHLFQF